jgi:hypothetical protein
MNLDELSSQALLALHAQIIEVLRDRKILRTSNNPVGDLAEHLFCKAYELQQETNSKAGVDAIGPDGIRYQIKGRKCLPQDKSRQLSAIRNLADADFDYLVGIIFSPNYSVYRAALIPYAIVKRLAKQQTHTNSHRFMLTDAVWNEAGVQNITDKLSAVEFL